MTASRFWHGYCPLCSQLCRQLYSVRKQKGAKTARFGKEECELKDADEADAGE